MKRRAFLQSTALTCFSVISVSPTSAQELGSRTSNSHFELDEVTISELQAGMKSGRYTAVSLARKYLERIDRLDRQGPRLGAVIELNPDALAIARELDRQRKGGRVRGPMHGIPVFLK